RARTPDSFPTRRSSDLVVEDGDQVVVAPAGYLEVGAVAGPHLVGARGLAVVLLLGSEAQHFRWLHEAVALEQAVAAGLRYGESADRKSTRLNSSHQIIS